jgi:hypothetical protein
MRGLGLSGMLTPDQINLVGTGGPPIELGGYIGERGVEACKAGTISNPPCLEGLAVMDGVNVNVTANFSWPVVNVTQDLRKSIHTSSCARV